MRVRRCHIIEEYARDGRTALYSDSGMVVVLSDLASAAWGALGEDWLDVQAVADLLVEQFGSPPDADALSLTEEALRQLAQHLLVEVDDGDEGDGRMGG